MSAERPNLFAFAVEAASQGTASIVAWATEEDRDRIVDWTLTEPGADFSDDDHSARLSAMYDTEIVFLGAMAAEQLETVTTLGDK